MRALDTTSFAGRTGFLLPALFFLAIACSYPGRAQQPLMRAVDAAALGAAGAQVSIGADYARKNSSVPAGEMSRLTRLFAAEARIGVSSNVDVTIGWRGRLMARPERGTGYSDWGDPYLSTKVVLTDSGNTAPAVALLSGVKLPSTRHLPHRLGNDATDFHFSFLLSHEAGGTALRFNAGLGIIGDPRAPGSQDDIYIGTLAFLVRALPGIRVFTEIHGFTGAREDDDKLQAAGGLLARVGNGEIGISARHRISGSPYDFGTAFEASEAWGVAAVYIHRISF